MLLSLVSVIFLYLWFLPIIRVAASPSSVPYGGDPVDPQSKACGDVIRSSDQSNVMRASIVYKCLASVPFNPSVATKFIQYYNDTLQFHSTLAYLKAPPPSYQQPKVDLIEGLNMIQTQINGKVFKNQYAFEAALLALIYSAHDSHLNIVFGITGVFSFGSSYSLASVSSDGIQLPKVYVANDLLIPTRGWKPSAIATIDGQNVVKYLSQFAAKNSLGGLERHTDWNSMMSSPVEDIQAAVNTWAGGATFYPGDTYTIVFENGTKIADIPWYAIYYSTSDTGSLETGDDFYNFFVLGRYPASYNESKVDMSGPQVVSSTPDETTTTMGAAPTKTSEWWGIKAFPTADVAEYGLGKQSGGSVSGYFLKKELIAVLSLPSFQEDGDNIGNFSKAVTKFIAASKKAGSKKVVIDLQQNYGGDALLAYDTFKQFFPTIDPYGGSQMRATPPTRAMGESITNYWNGLNDTDDLWSYFYADEWMASNKLDAATDKKFTSWDQFHGPVMKNGDGHTKIQRYNLSDPIFDTMALGSYQEDYQIYGYGSKATKDSAPYEAKDIVLLTDAICSSTCSLFVEMMHHEAKVKTVVAGGHPSYGPMQYSGLSRGARAFGTDNIDLEVTVAQRILESKNQQKNFLPNRTEALDIVVNYGIINLRDQIRKGEEIPLQFLYEAADCRIFFTPSTFYNQTALWKYAAEATWTKPQLCVKDSTGYTASKTQPRDVVATSNLLPRENPPENVDPRGAIIMAIISGGWNEDTSIEAGEKDLKGTPIDTSSPKDHTQERCKTSGSCGWTGYLCMEDFPSCSSKGVPAGKPYPGCVKSCLYQTYATSGANDVCGTKAKCVSTIKIDKSNMPLLSTVLGYCKPDKWKICSNPANVILPNSAAVPCSGTNC